LLIIMVVVFHLAVTYGASGHWPYREGHPDDLTSLIFTLFTAINGTYVIGMFFMIAGYFTPGSYDRKGFGPFMKDRLLRLGIPLLVYILVIDPLIIYAIRVVVHGYDGSLWSFLERYFGSYGGLGVGPLWFVEGLLILTVLYALWRLLPIPELRGPQREGKPPGNVAVALFALGLGIATFVVHIWRPVGWIYQPLGLPVPLFPQYVALFFLGMLAYRGNWLVRIPKAMGKLWFGIALFFIVVLFPIVFLLGGALEGNTDVFMGGLHWQSLAFAVWEEFVGIGIIIALYVLFRERFDRQGSLAKAMSDSSYAVYFIHAPVLVFLALALRGVRLYPLLKFALVAPVAVALCFVLAYLLRRLPGARRIL
jgi:surface polysaccharide O-acyltransferase-like enzyme